MNFVKYCRICQYYKYKTTIHSTLCIHRVARWLKLEYEKCYEICTIEHGRMMILTTTILSAFCTENNPYATNTTFINDYCILLGCFGSVLPSNSWMLLNIQIICTHDYHCQSSNGLGLSILSVGICLKFITDLGPHVLQNFHYNSIDLYFRLDARKGFKVDCNLVGSTDIVLN